ncbi:hypothetical protein [Streptomyces cirratus]|uniref:hypothetical protein n=1 Tax=Streptomyces cirratus TaxID=68187 RepID=UPI00360FA351
MSARPPAAAGRRSRASSPWMRRAAIVVSVISTVAVLDGPAVAVPAVRTAPAPTPRTAPAAAEAPTRPPRS